MTAVEELAAGSLITSAQVQHTANHKLACDGHKCNMIKLVGTQTYIHTFMMQVILCYQTILALMIY